MITGKDLLALALWPGKWFKEALEYINTHALAGDALHAYLNTVKSALVIPLLAEPMHFYANIRADTAVEQANIDYIRQSMQLLMRTPTVVAGAIMPDTCPAGPLGTIPVGGVVATRNAIHPGMHSVDICCSLMLINLGKNDPKQCSTWPRPSRTSAPAAARPKISFRCPRRFWPKCRPTRF